MICGHLALALGAYSMTNQEIGCFSNQNNATMFINNDNIPTSRSIVDNGPLEKSNIKGYFFHIVALLLVFSLLVRLDQPFDEI